MKDLFQSGNYTLHSGASSNFLIDLDALSDSSLAAIAGELAARLPSFGVALGVPRGGLRLASQLAAYCYCGYPTVLLVDDVLTTGASMVEFRDRLLAEDPRTYEGRLFVGAVAFARGPCPGWVVPLFTMTPRG